MSKVSLASGLRMEKKQNRNKTNKQTNKNNNNNNNNNNNKPSVAGHVSAGSILKALFVTLEINLRRLVS